MQVHISCLSKYKTVPRDFGKSKPNSTPSKTTSEVYANNMTSKMTSKKGKKTKRGPAFQVGTLEAATSHDQGTLQCSIPLVKIMFLFSEDLFYSTAVIKSIMEQLNVLLYQV